MATAFAAPDVPSLLAYTREKSFSQRTATPGLKGAGLKVIAINRFAQHVTKGQVTCDYLVIGAGLHCLAFVDELLAQHGTATVVIIDKQSAPGGHWNVAYPFVTLHQPAAPYGVNSEPLGANTNPSSGFEPYELDDLGTKSSLLAYFAKVVDAFVETGRVKYFRNASYEPKTKSFVTADGVRHMVTFRKLVMPTSNVEVPAMRPPPFRVGRGVDVRPVNDLSAEAEAGTTRDAYVVIGAGKTAMDAVVTLLERMNVPVDKLTWIVPRDMWVFLRDSMFRDASSFVASSVKFIDSLNSASDTEGIFLSLEAKGILGRVDTSTLPPVCHAAIILESDLALLRSMHAAGRIVRLGRVTSIDATTITLQKGTHPMPQVADTLVVDCTACSIEQYEFVDKPFTPDLIRLTPCAGYNISFAGAVFAWLEVNVDATEAMSADERKNSLVYTPQRKMDHPASVIESFYTLMKLNENLQRAGAASWALTARTNFTSTKHVPLSTLLWYVLGPAQMLTRSKRFTNRLESGVYDDVVLHEQWRANWAAEKAAEKAAKAEKARRATEQRGWLMDMFTCASAR